MRPALFLFMWEHTPQLLKLRHLFRKHKSQEVANGTMLSSSDILKKIPKGGYIELIVSDDLVNIGGTMDRTITIGRVVHYMLDGQTARPAIIVSIQTPQLVNLSVFIDGTNDIAHGASAIDATKMASWRTSVAYSQEFEKNTWHWPTDLNPRVVGVPQ